MSRPEHPTHTTGAHRSRSGASHRSRPQHPGRPVPSDRPEQAVRPERSVRVAWPVLAPPPGTPGAPGGQPHAARPGPPGRPGHPVRAAGYEPYLDGLFTYCLSVLCAHGAAAAVLGETLALAERQHGRRPDDPGLYRPWLYALARWACLRRLADPSAPDPAADPESGRRELARLAWPEAAGMTPEQREALELSVRHRLPAAEVAAVLGTDPVATRALLATASCEVERTRAALAVVERGHCPDVARLAGGTRMLLGAVLRRELVRHVDDCAECRGTAECATATGPWPGTAPAARGTLPLVAAPREAVFGALAAARRTRSGRAEGVAGSGVASGARRTGRSGGANGSPRYDRRGFPVRATDLAARRMRLRSRAMTTTIVATVLAAPVLALWAAYRGAPAPGEAESAPPVTAVDSDSGRLDGRPYENAGNAGTPPRPAASASEVPGEVTARVTGADGGRARRSTGPGRLTVTAQPRGATTVITLSASGGAPVRWTAAAGAPWLQLSRTAGELEPGRSTAVTVAVDHDREPDGPWRTRIVIGPGATAVTMEGRGGDSPGQGRPRPTPPAPTPPRPTTPAPRPTRPSPTPPTSPDPTPTGPTPTDSSTPVATVR
ncbi:BACON domain-containing protein [Streptomyces catenulae]|uniref:Sigma-70 family RNA polymerase sigma factor n=1 Tax=Streptomyces catenulae TaxID=66875 RepID=A0ABV2Z7S9_9ACTN|nr:sigma-70 family RNA polymerase sigma factor [Streptomyces catenulae]